MRLAFCVVEDLFLPLVSQEDKTHSLFSEKRLNLHKAVALLYFHSTNKRLN